MFTYNLECVSLKARALFFIESVGFMFRETPSARHFSPGDQDDLPFHIVCPGLDVGSYGSIGPLVGY